MERHLPQMPIWMTMTALVLVCAIIIVLAVTLRRTSSFDSAEERATQSSLLPDDWLTYGADVWSVGYPSGWKITSEPSPVDPVPLTAQLHFHPAGTLDTDEYFRVGIDARPIAAVEAAYASLAGVSRSTFRFAGYPAVKFSAFGRDEYYISYHERLYRISTDHPTSDEIGIMLATFTFLE